MTKTKNKNKNKNTQLTQDVIIRCITKGKMDILVSLDFLSSISIFVYVIILIFGLHLIFIRTLKKEL